MFAPQFTILSRNPIGILCPYMFHHYYHYYHNNYLYYKDNPISLPLCLFTLYCSLVVQSGLTLTLTLALTLTLTVSLTLTHTFMPTLALVSRFRQKGQFLNMRTRLRLLQLGLRLG